MAVSAHAATPKPGLILCTLGTSPVVIAELLAKVDSPHFRFLSPREAARWPIAEVWAVTTDGDTGRRSANELETWWKNIGASATLRVFRVAKTADLTTQRSLEEVALMDEAIARLALQAREVANLKETPLYASLAGGRKTMSATLQHAVSLFGVDELFHVLSSDDKTLTQAFDAVVNGRKTPIAGLSNKVWVVTLGGTPGQEALDSGTGKLTSSAFPLPSSGRSLNIRVTVPDRGERLLKHCEDRIRDASRVGRAFLSVTTDNATGEIFHSLLRLPLETIRQLKSYRLGRNSGSREGELAWVKRLPKADLHCHLGGVLTAHDVADIVSKIRLSRSLEKDINGLTAAMPRRGRLRAWLVEGQKRGMADWATVAGFVMACGDAKSLDRRIFGDCVSARKFRGIDIQRYVAFGDIQGSSLLTHPVALEQACRRLIARCKDDGVIHVEIRCSPLNYVSDQFMPSGEAVVARIVKNIPKERARLILIGTRHKDPEGVRRHVELALSRSEDVSGFDLAGDELASSPAGLRCLFLPLMKRSVPLTIHAGETAPVKFVWEAAYELGADRIGHGLTLRNNRNLMNKFRDRAITIEMCPSSNDQIVGFFDPLFDARGSRRKRYPLREYLEAGLRVTINTDNPGISRTTLSEEYLKASSMSSGLSAWEILMIARNGFAGTFLSHPERMKLINKADREVFDIISGGSVPW